MQKIGKTGFRQTLQMKRLGEKTNATSSWWNGCL